MAILILEIINAEVKTLVRDLRVIGLTVILNGCFGVVYWALVSARGVKIKYEQTDTRSKATPMAPQSLLDASPESREVTIHHDPSRPEIWSHNFFVVMAEESYFYQSNINRNKNRIKMRAFTGATLLVILAIVASSKLACARLSRPSGTKDNSPGELRVNELNTSGICTENIGDTCFISYHCCSENYCAGGFGTRTCQPRPRARIFARPTTVLETDRARVLATEEDVQQDVPVDGIQPAQRLEFT